MSLLKNAQSRVVAVLVSLFLGFVMPWVLRKPTGTFVGNSI